MGGTLGHKVYLIPGMYFSGDLQTRTKRNGKRNPFRKTFIPDRILFFFNFMHRCLCR